MGKGKNLNPADAHRKSLRKKELKKNKAERSKAREFALVKKDTREIEEDIQRLENAAELSPSDRTRLADLKSELENINKKKEEYVKEHPEHRKLVYRARRNEDQEAREEVIPQKRNLFKKNGLPRHPERSIYYDPVMNPFGVAPPGMPYIERPLRADEKESDDEENAEDDDIVMPEGPPPGVKQEAETEDSDDDIPMPDGPPPPKATTFPAVPLPNPPLPPGLPLLLHDPQLLSLPPPVPPGIPPSSVPRIPPGYHIPPFPPLGYVGFSHNPPHHSLPPLPPGFPMPPPPPGFFPRRQQSMSAMQDPLSSVPHETFQAHRARLTHPSLPPNPNLAIPATKSEASTTLEAATVSAQPQLRDLKKEATAFIPTSLQRKRPGAGSASLSKVNAAPSLGPDAVGSESMASLSRPDLLNTLKSQFGPAPGNTTSKAGSLTTKPKDDYEKFVEEMGDFLGPAK